MYDIIIVGGGPAGAMSGKYLAMSGKKVLLLQKDFTFKKPCGGGIRMDAFDEFNIDKSLIKDVVNEIVFETKKKVIDFDITETPLAIVDRTEFDENLRQDAAKAGAKVLERKVTKINIKDNFVEVFTSFNGEEQLYTSEYIIAADGVHSIVRKEVRGEEISKGLTHYSDVESLVTTKCHIYFGSDLTDQAYAWRFPYGTGSDLGTAAPKNGKNYISNLFKFLGIDKESKVKGYHIPQWNTPIFYDQRVFYVGDAAEQVLPFTYEGIYYAMKSAKILSDVLIEEADCKEYERRWNNLYLKKFKVLDRLQKIFLKNDFMIHIMMKTIEQERVKRKVLLLWMDNYELKIDFKFFIRVIKRMVS